MFTSNTKKGFIFVNNPPKKDIIHMFFLFQKLDMIFLDTSKRVINIRRNVLPFTLVFPKKKFKYLIELPKGKSKKTQLNDHIDF